MLQSSWLAAVSIWPAWRDYSPCSHLHWIGEKLTIFPVPIYTACNWLIWPWSVLVRYSSIQLTATCGTVLSVGFLLRSKGQQQINIIMKIGIQNEIDNNDFYIIEILYFNCQWNNKLIRTDYLVLQSLYIHTRGW